MLKIFLSNPFTNLTGSTGSAVSRLTIKNRFVDLDNCACNYISNGTRILDIGVSNGVTSNDLYQRLSSAGCRFQLSICDPYSKGSREGIIVKSYRDEFGEFICHMVGPVYFSSKLKYRWFISKLGGHIFNVIYNERRSRGTKAFCLLCDELRERIATREIRWKSIDIFRELPSEQYDFIRILNVLNADLFDAKRIESSLRKILACLDNGGLLLIGRTDGSGLNHATYYRKEKGKIEPIHVFHRGSELTQLLLGFNRECKV